MNRERRDDISFTSDIWGFSWKLLTQEILNAPFTWRPIRIGSCLDVCQKTVRIFLVSFWNEQSLVLFRNLKAITMKINWKMLGKCVAGGATCSDVIKNVITIGGEWIYNVIKVEMETRYVGLFPNHLVVYRVDNEIRWKASFQSREISTCSRKIYDVIY